MREIPTIHAWESGPSTHFCVACGNARDYVGHQMWNQMYLPINERNAYREIAINSELQWRKLHGEVVPYIQRESVENYIDNLAREKQKGIK